LNFLGVSSPNNPDKSILDSFNDLDTLYLDDSNVNDYGYELNILNTITNRTNYSPEAFLRASNLQINPTRREDIFTSLTRLHSFMSLHSEYEFIKHLGRGSYGDVYEFYVDIYGTRRAIKIADGSLYEEFRQLTKFKDIAPEAYENGSFDKDKDKKLYYIYMEAFDGDCSTYLLDIKSSNKEEFMKKIENFVTKTNQLIDWNCENETIFVDIKPGNFVFRKSKPDDVFKMIDFDTTYSMKETNKTNQEYIKNLLKVQMCIMGAQFPLFYYEHVDEYIKLYKDSFMYIQKNIIPISTYIRNCDLALSKALLHYLLNKSGTTDDNVYMLFEKILTFYDFDKQDEQQRFGKEPVNILQSSLNILNTRLNDKQVEPDSLKNLHTRLNNLVTKHPKKKFAPSHNSEPTLPNKGKNWFGLDDIKWNFNEKPSKKQKKQIKK